MGELSRVHAAVPEDRFARLAVVCLLVCLALCVGIFLWEIYSPEYGFRMPWLQF